MKYWIYVCFYMIGVSFQINAATTDHPPTTDGITPYKFTDGEYKGGFPTYIVPKGSIFNVPRTRDMTSEITRGGATSPHVKKDSPTSVVDMTSSRVGAGSNFIQKAGGLPPITAYISKPKKPSFPIAILCEGSSLKDSVTSVIHLHRYFLQDFLNIGAALIALEQWGVTDTHVDADMFMHHYTRSQRLFDHKNVMDHLIKNPPAGWNGKFIFVGVSEGGLIATALTEIYPEHAIGTVVWSGAGDLNWRDEVWGFIEDLRPKFADDFPWRVRLRLKLPSWMPGHLKSPLPKTRTEFDTEMDKTLISPTPDQEFLGMTYMYHADAFNFPPVDYKKLKTPVLIVAGGLDPGTPSTDIFVEKARAADAEITYIRVPDMDHYVRKRPDILKQSFAWIAAKINE